MYFLIYEIGGSLRKKIFDATTPWEVLLSAFKGTVVELFKSDKLTPRQFNDYFIRMRDLPDNFYEYYSGI